MRHSSREAGWEATQRFRWSECQKVDESCWIGPKESEYCDESLTKTERATHIITVLERKSLKQQCILS